eukprot:NODE_814_length_3983_cov_0.318229.p1 type:complete len:421 gc:universal NODE_814_length_3983_cov_0.318229:280-1542(+)
MHKQFRRKLHIFTASLFVVYILILLRPSPLSHRSSSLNIIEKSNNSNDFLAICLKTGMETNMERIPVQLLTFLESERPLIISDFEENVGNNRVVNILPPNKQRTTFTNNRHAESTATDEQKPNESKEGWKLDAYKNFPGFKKMNTDYPDSKWFIMLDDDTYLFKNNIIAHLKTLDHNTPYYLGAGNNFRGCDNVNRMGDGPLFAHGGSGIVLSKGALEKMMPVVDDCSMKYADCWAGDIRTALCLRDVGVFFNSGASRGDFHGNPVQKQQFSDPCQKPFTFHHLFPFQIQILYDLEVSVQQKFGHNAEINMGQIFKWILKKDPLLKTTFKNYLNSTVTDSLGNKMVFKYVIGVDLTGSDYYHFPSSLDDCILKCYEDVKCYSWTFTSRDNQCWMKNGIPSPLKVQESYSGWFEDKFKCNK